MHGKGAEHGILIKEGGFTLIELMISTFILAVGVLALLNLQAADINTNAESNRLAIATVVAQDIMENLMLLDYDDPALADNNTANNPPSSDFDSTDVAGGKTDNHMGFVTARNHTFNVFWNVADNYPVNKTKTINVIVTWTDGTTHSIIVRSVRY